MNPKQQTTDQAKPTIVFTTDKQNSKRLITKVVTDAIISDEEASDIVSATLSEAFGTKSERLILLLQSHAINGFFINAEQDAGHIATSVLEGMLEMKPKDLYESMLITRLLSLHSQYMAQLSQVWAPGQTEQVIDESISRSAKLMRVWNESFDMLQRYRNGDHTNSKQ